jgi:two-component system sensor histidine kinase/response regulator
MDQASRPIDDGRPGEARPGVALALDAHCFRLLIDAATDHAVCGLDASGRIASWNEGAARLLLYQADEIAGRPVSVLYGAEDRSEGLPEALLERAAALGRAEAEGWRLRKDGSRFRAVVAVTAVRDADGALLGFAKAVRDMTERRAAMEILATARREAEAASRARSELLATVSHEIRTPMHAVLGMVGLLLDDRLSPEQRRRVEAMRDAVEMLQTVTGDLLDFARLEAGRLRLDSVDFAALPLVESVLALFASQAGAKGIALGLRAPPDPPPALRGDPGRIRQVLHNLVANAIKFTDRGAVTVAMACQTRPDGRLDLQLEVSDTGIGIPLQAQPGLFTRFGQPDDATARRFGGTGLGLAICKQLVELMGGRIGFASEPGRGSRFWVAVPCAPGEPPAAAASPPASRALRILVAEDNLINQAVAVAMLSRLGHRIDAVGDGVQAVAAVQCTAYDVVLMDIEMPAMDGVEATRAIRRLPGPAGRVPIVALTANAMEGQRERYLGAGMSGYLAKPVSLAALREALARCIDGGATPGLA